MAGPLPVGPPPGAASLAAAATTRACSSLVACPYWIEYSVGPSW